MDDAVNRTDSEAGRRMAVGWKWVTEHTPNPNPELGRSGVVCPYMIRALRRNYVHMEAFDATEGRQALVERGRWLREDMHRRGANMGPDRMYLVSIVVPYGLPEVELRSMVMQAHGELRLEFVHAGYVPGDFWPQHETVGLHSNTFRPFNSPIPMLGMRNMVPADLAFFTKQEPSPERRMTYLRVYREVFDGQLNEYWADMLDEAEIRTREELAAAGSR
jgi:hypothetical protein